MMMGRGDINENNLVMTDIMKMTTIANYWRLDTWCVVILMNFVKNVTNTIRIKCLLTLAAGAI